MKRDEAPPPGWYPDPTGRRGLLWWDGLDWTHHRRPLPTSLPERAPDDPATASGDGRAEVATATQLRSRRQTAGVPRQEVTEAVAEVRRATREEVQRAVAQATSQFEGSRSELLGRLAQWRRRVRRLSRVAAIVVVLFVVLSAWASATLQTSLLDWLGERIDAATATVVPRHPSLADR